MMCDFCGEREIDFACAEGPEHHQPLFEIGIRPDPWAVKGLCADCCDQSFWPHIHPVHRSPLAVGERGKAHAHAC